MEGWLMSLTERLKRSRGKISGTIERNKRTAVKHRTAENYRSGRPNKTHTCKRILTRTREVLAGILVVYRISPHYT